MSFETVAYNVMLASPGDVAIERNIAREVIADWNAVHAYARRLVLLPTGWETHASPTMGVGPQEVINRQVLRNADLVIGIFWTRIGTPTTSYASGTVEEIEEHIKAQKPVMLYFSDAPVRPGTLEPAQYQQLQDFRTSLRARGLYDTFASAENFRAKFSHHLQLKLNQDHYFTAKVLPTETLAEDLAIRLQRMIDKYLQNVPRTLDTSRDGDAIHPETSIETVERERVQDLMTITHQIQAPLIGVANALSGISPNQLPRANAELVQHARALVEDTIDVSYGTFTAFALAAGQPMSFASEPMDIATELRQLVTRVQQTYPRSNVRFVIRCVQDNAQVNFDSRIFSSVIYSLLHNAVRYADDSTDVVVECSRERLGEEYVIKVKSIGAPILPSEREVIFDRFRRGVSVSGGRIYHGIGLGLWVSRQLMLASGGDVTLDLSPDYPRLSVFSVKFRKGN